MKNIILTLILITLFAFGAIENSYSMESETFTLEERITEKPTRERFTNANWFSVPHPKVASFTMFADGSSEGYTVDGVAFVQYNVPNLANIRVQRFEIEDHHHYIVDGEIIESFEEFSARLALAYYKRIPNA